MRERKTQINFRVYQTEKDAIHSKAKRCGMTDADYIRNCALDRVIMEMPREGLKTAYLKLNPLIRYLEQYSDDFSKKEVVTLKSIQEILLDLYRGKEVTEDGGNQDLAGEG